MSRSISDTESISSNVNDDISETDSNMALIHQCSIMNIHNHPQLEENKLTTIYANIKQKEMTKGVPQYFMNLECNLQLYSSNYGLYNSIS